MKTELIWEGKYDEYGNRLIWGDNKFVMASLLRDCHSFAAVKTKGSP
jgi:hypothetical protein